MSIFSNKKGEWIPWFDEATQTWKKTWTESKESKYAKPAFIILILMLIGIGIYSYNEWDGTWPEPTAEDIAEDLFWENE